MSEACTFSVSEIKIQKDKYKTNDGETLGETDFWKSTDNEGYVLRFKRAIVQCHLKGLGVDDSIELIISLRAGFVKVRIRDRREGLDAHYLALILRELLGLLYHVPGHPTNGVLLPISSNDTSRYSLCKTYDSHWLLGTLHEVMEEKEMGFKLSESDVDRLQRQRPTPAT